VSVIRRGTPPLANRFVIHPSVRAIEADPSTRALLHNTISVTMLEAGRKVNVIPPLAVARLDTRLVPGQKLDQWIAELASVIRDDRITIEPFMAFEATDSPLDTELAKRLQEAVGRRFPGVIVTYPVIGRVHRQPLLSPPRHQQLWILAIRSRRNHNLAPGTTVTTNESVRRHSLMG
jgi:acetylornithine deacetylase/succinyl-diaminopimelate desuccinylase-like protein